MGHSSKMLRHMGKKNKTEKKIFISFNIKSSIDGTIKSHW